MTQKLFRKYTTLGHKLVCKICDCPIDIMDRVESKGKNKVYHAKCYDDSHITIESTTSTTTTIPMFDKMEKISFGKAEEIK
jgi:hypothetical protein